MRLFHGEVPDLVLWAIVAGWVITQVLTTGGALYLLRDGAKKRDEVVEHFDGRLEEVKEELKGEFATDALERKFNASAEGFEAKVEDVRIALEARLDELKIDDRIGEVRDEVRQFWTEFSGFGEQLGKDMKTLQMTFIGEKGMETAALQRYLDSDHEIDDQIGMMEAVASEDPELIVQTALAKAAAISPSDKWVAENPIKAGIWEAAKPVFLGKLAEFMGAQLGVPGRPRLPARGRGGNRYGL